MKKFWNWGVGIATVYAVFAGATLGFVVFAMQQPVDLVSPGYYAEAQAHDLRQAAEARALALGDRLRVDVDPRLNTVTVSWPIDARPESGRIRFYRPSDSHADKQVTISAGAHGQQVVSVADLAAGNWRVQCEWTVAGHLFYLERSIVLR